MYRAFRVLVSWGVMAWADGEVRAAATRLWTTGVELAAPPAVGPDGVIIAVTSAAVVALSPDGVERWRVAQTTTSPAQPASIDETGDILALTRSELTCISAAGVRRWA